MTTLSEVIAKLQKLEEEYPDALVVTDGAYCGVFISYKPTLYYDSSGNNVRAVEIRPKKGSREDEKPLRDNYYRNVKNMTPDCENSYNWIKIAVPEKKDTRR